MDVNDIKFPKTFDKNIWINFLERDLTIDEHILLKEVKAEKYFNMLMKKMYNVCEHYGLCVPKLTIMNGNCLFESLECHGIGECSPKFRSGLAYFMYVYQDYKNLLPGDSCTLAEKFTISNIGNEGTELVVCKNDNMAKGERKFYKYTYNVMCQDLSNEYSWSKLESQLILTFISFLYRLDIHVIGITPQTHSYIKINAYENSDVQPELTTIYLANINNMHYVSLRPLIDGEQIRQMLYLSTYQKFSEWAEMMEKYKRQEYLKIIIKKMEKDDEDDIFKDLPMFN